MKTYRSHTFVAEITESHLRTNPNHRLAMRERALRPALRLGLHLGGVLLLVIVMPMRSRAEGEVHQREEGEDVRLNESDEDLEEIERDRAEHREKEADHDQQHLAGEDIAEETEAERDDAQRLEQQLQQADDQPNRPVLQGEV